MSDKQQIFSIGHSALSYEQFLELLRKVGVDAVADMRTLPYSGHFPHFNQDALRAELKQDGVAYAFLGRELGGRPSGSQFYCEGVVDYEKMAESESFKNGVSRVVAGAEKFRVALMCSEKHPLDCHRCLLIGRALLYRGLDVQHIVSEKDMITQSALEEELMTIAGNACDDLFATRDERLAIAYRARARKMAYSSRDLMQGAAAIAE